MSIDRILALKLVTDVGDINSKMGQVEAQTSKVGAAFKTLSSFVGPIAITAALVAVEKLGDALTGGMEDARKFDDAVAGLGATLEPLGVAAGEVKAFADEAARLGTSLGFLDDDQVVRSLQAFAEQTQSVTEAQALLAAAMDLSRLKGISLEEATGKVQAIYKGASRTLAEFGVSGVSGMAAVTAALGDNATAAETWATTTQGKYAVVAASIDDVFQSAGAAINTAIDTVILPAISELLPVIGDLWAQWQPTLQAAADGVGTFVGKVVEVWNRLQPSIQAFMDFVAPVLDNFAIVVGTTFSIVTQTLDAVIALLNGDFTGAWNAITGVVQSMYDGVVGVIGNFLKFLGAVVESVGKLAGNIGKSIYDGIASGFNSLWTAVKGVVNSIIGALNSINSFSWERQGFEVNTVFGNAFVGVGAGSVQMWPDIPLLAKGGIVNRPTLAMIGEAGPEAVVPLGRGGGMGSTYNITVNVAPGGDLVEAGRQMVRAITSFERRSGRVWRSA